MNSSLRLSGLLRNSIPITPTLQRQQALKKHTFLSSPSPGKRFLTMASSDAPRLRLQNSAIFVCDLQEKFRKAIWEFDKVILTTQKVLKAAHILQIPIYVTTQNRARLGETVAELVPYLPPPSSSSSLVKVDADKTLFSMWVPEIAAALPPAGNGAGAASVVIVGIESHICVTQTALDLLRAGHRVYVLADGVSSCNREEVPVALARLRAEGATVTSSEGWLYECVGDAASPQFRAVVALVKESAADTRSALHALLAPPTARI